MNNGNNILICGNFAAPDGNAAGKRVYGIGLILRSLGYTVHFLGTNGSDESQERDDFKFHTYCKSKSMKDWLNVGKYVKAVRKVIDEIGIDNLEYVFFYGSNALSLSVYIINKSLRKKKIKTVFDCVDWIEKTGSGSVIKDGVKYIDVNLAKRFFAKKMSGVMVISKYLYDYYKSGHCESVIIPPVGEYKPNINKKQNEKVTIVYAGNVFVKGKKTDADSLKDRIDKTIHIMYGLKSKNVDFVLKIYGMTEEEYLFNIPEDSKIIRELGSNLQFFGCVDNKKVVDEIAMADFTILNRDITKVTTAGFPSKVAESLCIGTPVITNSTGDMETYITDYKNGLILSFDIDKAVEQLTDLFEEPEKIKEMSKYCCMECAFDYSRYKNDMKNFLDKI